MSNYRYFYPRPRPFYPLYSYPFYSSYGWINPYGGYYPYYQLGTSYHSQSSDYNGGLQSLYVPL